MEDRPMTLIMRELMNGFSGLVRGEIRLAKAELTENAKDAGKQAAKVGIFGFIAYLGAWALFASLIIGLGAALDNYWLSALIVGLVFVAVGGLMAMQAIKHMKLDASLRATTRSLEQDRDLITGHVRALPRSRESSLHSDRKIPA